LASTYGEALLLAAAGPYQLASGEMDRVLAQIRTLPPPQLTAFRPGPSSTHHWVVRCDADQGPTASAALEPNAPQRRWVNTGSIVEKLRRRKLAFESGAMSLAAMRALGPEGAALLARLIARWGDPPRRAGSREASEGTVGVCVGLANVTRYVRVAPSRPAAATDSMHDLRMHAWEVVNRCPGGLKLRSRAARQAVSVGELIGVREPGNASCTIGAVRWLSALTDASVECGVELLADSSRAVSVRPTIASFPTPQRDALVIESRGSERSLLTAPGMFSQLRELEIHDGVDSSCVRATRMIDRTARYERKGLQA
jgi:hypothetical protein